MHSLKRNFWRVLKQETSYSCPPLILNAPSKDSLPIVNLTILGLWSGSMERSRSSNLMLMMESTSTAGLSFKTIFINTKKWQSENYIPWENHSFSLSSWSLLSLPLERNTIFGLLSWSERQARTSRSRKEDTSAHSWWQKSISSLGCWRRRRPAATIGRLTSPWEGDSIYSTQPPWEKRN